MATNSQIERTNRTLNDVNVRSSDYGSHDQQRHHLRLFLDAYDHARCLKTLCGLTPCGFHL